MAKIICHLCGTRDVAPPAGEVWECPQCGNMKESAPAVEAKTPVRVGRSLLLFAAFIGLCLLVYFGQGWLEEWQNQRAREEFKDRMENWELK